MKISVLCENTTNKNGILAEHGLSLYIESDKHNILFDSGQTDLFAKNAHKMRVDLMKIDIAILSHGHYDHSGGFNDFLKINKTAMIYANENVSGLYYNGTNKYIGLDETLKNNNRVIHVGDSFNIDDELSLHTFNKEPKNYFSDSFGLNIRKGENFYPDDFVHEQYLIINDNNKKILISGCSHKGILNIIKWFTPDVFIGGFHLSKLNPETDDKFKLKEIADILLSYPTKYYTGHCTGLEQYQYLKRVMGARLEYISAGNEIVI